MSPDASHVSGVQRVPFQLEPAPGRVVRGDVRIPGTDSPGVRAIIVCHGFKGFKDWGFFPHLAERLAADTDSVTVSFNFSGSGIGPDLESFTDLEAFGHNTFSREIEDLEAVVSGMLGGRLGEAEVPVPSRLGLVGHSRGAASVLLVGAARPEVQAVVTWAGIGSVFRYESWLSESLDADGVMHVLNARTGQQLPLYRDVLDDLRARRERLDMEGAARRLGHRLLLVHGSDDEAVPPEEGRILQQATGGSALLAIVAGAGHTFGASHPFPGTNPLLDEAVGLTVDHFGRFLKGGAP